MTRYKVVYKVVYSDGTAGHRSMFWFVSADNTDEAIDKVTKVARERSKRSILDIAVQQVFRVVYYKDHEHEVEVNW